MKEGGLLAAQAAHTGLNELFQAFVQEHEASPKKFPEQLASIDFSTLKRTDAPILYDVLDGWRLDITRVLYALAKHKKGHEIPGILFTGEGSCHLWAWNNTLSTLQYHTFSNRLSIRLFSLTPSQLLRFAIPIGAALSGLPTATNQVNSGSKSWRIQTLGSASRNRWQSISRFVLGLQRPFYIFGETYLGYQEDQAREEYVALLGAMNKSYPVFGERFYSETSSGKDSDEEMLSVNLMTQEEIAQRLQYLHKELKNTPDSFPLLANTPRVSEVLAWLSTHPSATAKDSETGVQTSLQIDSFSYTMVKRPEPKKTAREIPGQS